MKPHEIPADHNTFDDASFEPDEPTESVEQGEQHIEANFEDRDEDNFTPVNETHAQTEDDTAPANITEAVKTSHIQESESDMPTDTIDLSLEAIQTLTLDSVVEEDSEDATRRQQEIATLEAIVFDGVSPEQLNDEAESTNEGEVAEEKVGENQEPDQISVYIPPHIAMHAEQKPLPKTSSNPFLPQHILDRLNDGRRNLVEEIARSGAELESSTAILRARTKTERNRHFPNAQADARDPDEVKKQQLVEDIVEEFLPALADELRKRLREQLDQND